MKYICLIFISVFIFSGCHKKQGKRYPYFQKYELNINCGELYKGIVYEMGSNATFYQIQYKEKESGNIIELPDNLCIKIRIKTFPIPNSNLQKNYKTEN